MQLGEFGLLYCRGPAVRLFPPTAGIPTLPP